MNTNQQKLVEMFYDKMSENITIVRDIAKQEGPYDVNEHANHASGILKYDSKKIDELIEQLHFFKDIMQYIYSLDANAQFPVERLSEELELA